MSLHFAPPSQWRLLPVAALTWLLVCIVMVVAYWHNVLTYTFEDPDDALRYVEARSFADGQGWFDVSQHRVNWPIGGMMHWSRIVDLPISGLMRLLRPVFGPVIADQIAVAIVPLILFFLLIIMTGLAVRRLGGTLTAIVAMMLIGLSLPIIVQFMPMRIDHHGWQILMSAVSLWAAFDTQPRRGGVVAGLAVSLWMHISSEGLPYAVMFFGIFALNFLRHEKAWERLSTYLGALCLGSAALLLATRGWPDAGRLYCDAISPVYVLPMMAALLALIVSYRLVGSSSRASRFLTLALAGTAAIAAYLAIGGQCRAGPFSALDPLVYKDWYLRIPEGRPVWEQSPDLWAIIVFPPLIGLAGMVLHILRDRDAENRFKWIQMLLLACGAYAVSVMVMRAMGVANLWALPGIAYFMVTLLPRAQGLKTAPGRIVATLGVFCLTPMFIICAAAAVLAPFKKEEKSTGTVHLDGECATKSQLQGLAALPRSVILAPLDVGPALLAFTPHYVVSTGHHRNNLAMKDVMLTFMAPQDKALAVALQRHATYIAYCPGLGEIGNYRKLGGPNSLIQDLVANRPPSWLTPVRMRPGESIQVYRINAPPKR
ncbi:MAG: hypothetical protein ACSLE1_20405 [Sphingobium sp.]